MSILVVPGYDDRRVYCTHPNYDSMIEYDGIMNKKVKFYSEHRVGSYGTYDGVTMTLTFNPDSVEITLDRKMMEIMMNIMYKKCDGVIKVIRDSSYVYSAKEGYYIPPRLEPTKIIETGVLNRFLSHDFKLDERAFITTLFNDYGKNLAYAYLKCPDEEGNISASAVQNEKEETL